MALICSRHTDEDSSQKLQEKVELVDWNAWFATEDVRTMMLLREAYQQLDNSYLASGTASAELMQKVTEHKDRMWDFSQQMA